MKKEFAVLGLGEFGSSLAIALENNGCQVLAVDRDEERVQQISDFVTSAICADVANQAVVNTMGLGNMDGVIVGIGNNLESSIMATICSKESGSKYVMAKANSDIQAEILRRVGADQVIFPEKAMADRLGKTLSSKSFLDAMEVSKKYSIVEVQAPARWIGKTVKNLDLRRRGINIIGRKREGEDIEIIVDPDRIIEASDTYIVIGANKNLDRELS